MQDVEINSFSRQLQTRIYHFDNPSPGKILLVGDKPGPGTPLLQRRVPFCTDKHCSGWLNKLLPLAEEQLRWVNSADEFGIETPFDRLKLFLPCDNVIALGGNASRWLTKLGIKHHVQFHPQYWKRFRHNEPYPLIELLRQLGA